MTCRETIRFSCEYLNGELSPEVVREIDKHLESCEDCRMILEAARKTLVEEFDYDEIHFAA